MPASVATILCLGLIAYLFWRDVRERPKVTAALWLPIFWFVLIGSKSLGQWLMQFGVEFAEGDSADGGSPVDASVYFVLILLGLQVLYSRRVKAREIFGNNRWLTIFLLYCFISVFWSDYSFIAFKRWIKILGHPIMTLVVFTEPDPREAMIRLFKRTAYVLAPLSILFIKYFPKWGRGFDPSGFAMNTGCTTDKNSLGSINLVLGFFFFWYALQVWQWEKGKLRKRELIFCGIFLLMTGWLLRSAHSSTSVVSFLVAATVVLILATRRLNLRKLGFYIVTITITVVVANELFGLFDLFLALLGKDPTLTDRTDVWHNALKIENNPFVGTGFESFWLGERRDKMWAIYWWHPTQAHNGYVETYLHLGFVGLGIMLILIVSAYRKGARMLFNNFELARFRLGFLAAFVLYNVTEAAFKALHPVWFMFYLIAIELPALTSVGAKNEVITKDDAEIFTPS